MKSGYQSCQTYATDYARCPPGSSDRFEFGGAGSGQLWRAVAEVCATFYDGSYDCGDVNQQVQF